MDLAERKVKRRKRVVAHHFDPALLFKSMRSFPKLEEMKESQVLQALVVALRVDSFRRSSDIAQILTNGITFSFRSKRDKWPQEAVVPMKVKESAKRASMIKYIRVFGYRDARFSTPALLKRYKAIVWDSKRRVTCSKKFKIEDEDGKLHPPLLVEPGGNTLVRTPLKAGRLSDMMFGWMNQAGIVTSRQDKMRGASSHDLCGAAPSKLVNLGKPKKEVAGSRWAVVDTFDKRYFRQQKFPERWKERAAKMSKEEILRTIFR